MSLSLSDFQHAERRFPSLKPIYGTNGQIDRVTVDFRGIVGAGNKAPMVYKAIITFDGFPNTPPITWITFPTDAQIRHVNIFHPGAPLNLPHVCMGNYGSIWSGMARDQRTLLHFLLAVHHVLLTENPASAARR